MSDKFECDRCGYIGDGLAEFRYRPHWSDKPEIDLCESCYKKLKTWVRNGSTEGRR